MLTLPTILQAHRLVAPYSQQTPLVRSAYLSQLTQADVWLKLENQQPTGSFKIRGALHKLMQLTPAQKQQGVVAASAGNHALGVAYAAQKVGPITADIFVPKTAPKAKVEKIRRFAVHLQLVGQTYEDAQQAAKAFAKETGGTEISAYDDVDIIAGQGTIGLEILTELPQTDTILVPVGGGGLIAGIAVVAQAMHPICRVVGVQPKATQSGFLSLRDGVAYDPYDHKPTLADGLAGGFGRVPFQIAKTLIDQILLTDEAMLRRAIFTLLDQAQLVVEASGAVAIAPLLQNETKWQGQTIVCVLSGGNLDTNLLRDILVEFTM